MLAEPLSLSLSDKQQSTPPNQSAKTNRAYKRPRSDSLPSPPSSTHGQVRKRRFSLLSSLDSADWKGETSEGHGKKQHLQIQHDRDRALRITRLGGQNKKAFRRQADKPPPNAPTRCNSPGISPSTPPATAAPTILLASPAAAFFDLYSQLFHSVLRLIDIRHVYPLQTQPNPGPLLTHILPYLSDINTNTPREHDGLNALKTRISALSKEAALKQLMIVEDELEWWETGRIAIFKVDDFDLGQPEEEAVAMCPAVKALCFFGTSPYVVYPSSVTENRDIVTYTFPYGLILTFSVLAGKLELDIRRIRGDDEEAEDSEPSQEAPQTAPSATRHSFIASTKAAFKGFLKSMESHIYKTQHTPTSQKQTRRTLCLIFTDDGHSMWQVQAVEHQNGEVTHGMAGEVAPRTWGFWEEYVESSTSTLPTGLDRIRWIMEGVFLALSMMLEGGIDNVGIFLEGAVWTISKDSMSFDTICFLQACWDGFVSGGWDMADPFLNVEMEESELNSRLEEGRGRMWKWDGEWAELNCPGLMTGLSSVGTSWSLIGEDEGSGQEHRPRVNEIRNNEGEQLEFDGV
ncbi:hypothetical protein BJ508DRAFT_327547 [Ascobolus immersus RN42]|uniref:Uncharacterized protein n=1 Tax=Ascobolus immersus RN42 TaxID=1160509 RepID=A0A3N4I2L3_ASCIM|nr:hypothetical protein BJ508DRAFT_327547 [Ascobolus immersus RN42]